MVRAECTVLLYCIACSCCLCRRAAESPWPCCCHQTAVLCCLRLLLMQVSYSEPLMEASWWAPTWRVCRHLECLLLETAAREVTGCCNVASRQLVRDLLMPTACQFIHCKCPTLWWIDSLSLVLLVSHALCCASQCTLRWFVPRCCPAPCCIVPCCPTPCHYVPCPAVLCCAVPCCSVCC
jgi:hypothetical protein